MAELSTLCYIEKEKKYLMLHRTVKKNDVNKDKWIGVGGHFEPDESPEECLLREVKEETGYTLTSYKYRGMVTFVSGSGVTEYMSLFTADGFEGEQISCDEGELAWVEIEDVWKLNLWEGDKIFFRLLDEKQEFFSLKLVYNGHDTLESAALNGKAMELLDVLKEDGTKTGMVRESGVAHREGSIHASVHVWVIRKNHKESYDVLLRGKSGCNTCFRKDADGFHPAIYCIPAAGHVEAGEDIAASAVRRMQKELDLTAEEELHYVGSHRREAEGVLYGKRIRDREIVSVYVHAELTGESSIRLQEGAGEERIWMDCEECLKRAHTGRFPAGIDEEELRMVSQYLRDYRTE